LLLFPLLAFVFLSCRDAERRAASRARMSDSTAQGYNAFQEQRRLGYDANGNAVSMRLSAITVTGEAPLRFSAPADASASMLIREATWFVVRRGRRVFSQRTA